MNTIKVRKRKISDLALLFSKSKGEQGRPSGQQFHMAIKYFEYWMDEESIKLIDIKRSDIEQFQLKLSKSGLGLNSKHGIRRYLQRYFVWLKSKELVKGNPKDIFPRMGKRHKRMKVILPNEALQFLTVMGIQIKQNSVNVYRASLKKLHGFLEENNVDIKDVTKSDMYNFLIYLGKENLANSAHRMTLILLKNYLRWLYESGLIKLEPDQLIEYNDIPKVEKRLPRPLAPEIDKVIQDRLNVSKSILHHGLLIMRKTGIRIGELTALKYDCLKANINEDFYLKVEIGKLYTERLVPLHEDTVLIIKRIQKETKKYCDNPQGLIHLEDGRKVVSRDFMHALDDVSFGFNTEKPIVSHQFRHTFACEMLNCGMSLVVLKEILGHKDIQMTLQLGTIREEFAKAYGQISKQYELPSKQINVNFEPQRALEEVISCLKNTSPSINVSERKKLNLIGRRLCRIRNELSDIPL